MADHCCLKTSWEDTSMVIGLSLSLCIKDLISRKKQLSDVEMIITRTACENEEDWKSLIAEYKELHWQENPGMAERLVRLLIAKRKIQQPRLQKKHIPCIDSGHWVNNRSEIIWDAR